MALAGQRVLVVVPARGGSKGIPLKNLHPLAGRPLLAHTAALIKQLSWVDRAVVSTDHLLIRDTALEWGLDAPFMRPEPLAGDRIGDLEVLTHALTATEADDRSRYDLVMMLQPTSPLRRPEHVLATAEKLIADNLDAVWTVSPTDLKAHPLKQLTLGEDGSLQYYDPAGAGIIARQQLTPVYHRNGAAYAFTRACLLEQGTLTGDRTGAVVIDAPMVSIDTLEDIARVESVLQEVAGQETASGGGSATRPRPRRLVVDIDGVIAQANPALDYAEAGPIRDNIARINALFDAGCEIVLFTARGTQTGKDWSEVTRAQMERWGVRHHALLFGKPHADYYIDDRLTTLHQALALCGLEDPVTQK